ncbi:MAG: Na+/H+ antiporter NhaA [Hydrogenophaga sp.]|jgi:Na+:H+ antiporter, NhaA family|uniref:Na+/H+ antiporter NhaA n=1 Tax=Hydrogenophaga sp. TaxID=1904254 RepID=UPI00261984A3|nr:Na+/H+ antiporter NhaA [Hydrogenophaga sp.]MCW5668386.1 Na+/H+ antiporter NhaA [Hydrogenophaga sp.]
MNRAPSRQNPPRAQLVADRAFAALSRFLHIEAVSGVVLLLAAAVALIWANSPASASYHAIWHAPLTIGIGPYVSEQSLHFWINDALMAVFFLVVGMEIRREIHEGALASFQLAALPLAAALGGVLVPALIYTALNTDPTTLRGWAVPTATDIAFAVGVLALLGRSIPGNVRVLLLALAIIDDIVAVLIIAFFYSGGLDFSGLLVAGLGVAMVLGLQQIGIGSAWAYVLPGAVLWLGLLQTGAHPTLAGVVLGLMTPVLPVRMRGQAPVLRVQMALHPWVAYGVMPLFALANAGVTLDGVDLASGNAQAVTLGVVLALVLGKPLGVLGASWLAVRLGLCRLPSGVTWSGVGLVGLLAGIGFTMSIFIATLAFDDPQLLGAAKLGVLLASLVAAVLGLSWGFLQAWRGRRIAPLA